MKKTKVVETKNASLYEKQSDSIEKMIMKAIDKGTPVETMEKVLALRDKLKKEYAKEQFDLAMAGFQDECPVIKKNKQVMEKTGNKVRYSYAPLDDIVAQVKKALSNNGFSYSVKVKTDDKLLTVICISTHKLGHSEESEFAVPLGTEQYMSDVQKYGARLTFAKRYAFCNAFGIMTGDGDNDGSVVDKAPANVKTVKEVEVIKMSTLEQVALIKELCEAGKVNIPEYKKALQVKTFDELSEKVALEVIDQLSKMKK